jgi:hypothetical protein
MVHLHPFRHLLLAGNSHKMSFLILFKIQRKACFNHENLIMLSTQIFVMNIGIRTDYFPAQHLSFFPFFNGNKRRKN